MGTLKLTLFFFLLLTQFCIAQWYEQNSGTTKTLNAVAFTDDNNGIAVGDSGTILRTTDGGTSWTPVATQTTSNLCAISFPDVSNIWIVGGGGFETYILCLIMRSSDGGSTWAGQIEDTLGEIRDVWFVDNMVGFAVGAVWDTLGYGHSVLLKTTDSGISWNWSHFDAWGATTFDYIDANTWWIQSRSAGIGGSSERFYKTEDSGTSWSLRLETWTGIHGQGPPRTNDIHFRDSSNGVAVGEAIYRTTDGGDTWVDTLVLAQGTVNKVTFGDDVTGTAVGESIYRTTDGGVSWNVQTSGTANSLRGVCFIDASTGWAVGDNGTILHTTNGGVSFVEEEQIDEVPTEFLLSQNYPNPFNPLTSIQYAISSRQYVSLKVFDALGNEIETLVKEEKPVGTYEVTWYSENLPSGVYFYQLLVSALLSKDGKAGSFVETKKMIFLK